MNRQHNGLKTAVLLALLAGLILLAGQWIGGRTGLIIALIVVVVHALTGRRA